jgi:hypothetical protein
MNKIEKAFLVEGICAFGLSFLLYFAAGLSEALYLLSMPFEFMGKGLRWLSLSSFAGNIIAILLYAMISLIPMFYLLLFRLKAETKKADLLLPVISLYSFYLLYEFINPGLMLLTVPMQLANDEFLPGIKFSFSLIFYALCFAYLVFRFLENLAPTHPEERLSFLCKKLRTIILISTSLYVFYLGYFATFSMFENIRKYAKQGSTTFSLTFQVISYLLEGLPVLFSIFTLVSGTRLLDAMAFFHMQEEEVREAMGMGKISKCAVYVTVLCNLALNALQFLFQKQLYNTSYQLEISFIPLIIAFSAVILSGFFKQTKELKEDNEMII